MSVQSASAASEKKIASSGQLQWIDRLKSVGILWIVANHVVERIFGTPYFANPNPGWPDFSTRAAQLLPFKADPIWNLPLNLLRYLGWTGDQGVQLFLIASGFGLTWSLLKKGSPENIPLKPFYEHRARRIYPLWWAAHFFFLGMTFVAGWGGGYGLRVSDPRFYLSLLGVRFTSDTLYYFAASWWFIGLILQLYLIYPLIWKALRRFGPVWVLAVGALVGFAARAAGLLLFHEYMDAWLRGAVFITRLPEFLFGVSLAAWYARDSQKVVRILRSRTTTLLAAAAFFGAVLLSLTWAGNIITPFLFGVSSFAALFPLLSREKNIEAQHFTFWRWIGRHSYGIFLVHYSMILLFVPEGLGSRTSQYLIGIFLALLLTLAISLLLEKSVEMILNIGTRWYRKSGTAGILWRLTAIGGMGMVLLFGSEWIIQRMAPQEVLGWGEKASMAPNPQFGWYLKPSQVTRLRWKSYDYTVTTNALGFPGPEYSKTKKDNNLRILVTGDAFTSAEGVDTALAWPRLLETELAQKNPNRNIEVLNFAVTGYGPNQYAAVVETFAPVYQPDLILIGFFVNDFQDVLISNAGFVQGIGFEVNEEPGLRSLLKMRHLHALINERVKPIMWAVRGKIDPNGYFLGNFAALERGNTKIQTTGSAKVSERLQEIQNVATATDAEVLLVMIPAPVQVCRPEDLGYYPDTVNLNDPTVYDLNQPQQLTEDITARLGMAYHDLRPVLQSLSDCPYQKWNMHWTAQGHQAVADHLAEVLSTMK